MCGGGGDDSGQTAEEMAAKQAEISALESALHEMQRSFQERLSEAREQAEKTKKKEEDLSLPHIANLNEDELLTNKLRFAFKEGRTRIGRSTGEDGGGGPDVGLAGPGIQKNHATVTNNGAACVLVVMKQAIGATFVNGSSLEGKEDGVTLKHGDRVVFGQCIFVFVNPSEGKAAQLLHSGKVNYAMARKELNEQSCFGPSEEELKASREMAENLERRAKEAEEAKSKAKAEAESLLKLREEEFKSQMEQRQQEWEKTLQDQRAEAQASDQAAAQEQAKTHAQELEKLQKEFEERQARAEQAAQRRIEELEKKAKKAAAEEEDHRQHELSMQRLEEQLMVVMPLVKEANMIASELKRPHRLETKMHCELGGAGIRGSIQVMVAVFKDGVQLFEWSPETLENRVFMMRDILQRCEDEGFEACSRVSCEEDPLWDPIQEERLIGVSQVLMEGLLLQVENQVSARILSTDGQQAGTLRVEVTPLAQDGTPGIPDSEVVDQPEELLGTRMGILLEVKGATDLPEVLANDVWIEYNYFIDDKAHKVPAVPGHNRNPEFGYKQVFIQDPVTSRFLEYLQTKLVFRVYGKDAAAVEAAKAPPEVPPEPVPAEVPPEPLPAETSPGGPGCSPGAESGSIGLPGVPSSPLSNGKPPVPSLSQVRREVDRVDEEPATVKQTKSKGSVTCSIL